MKQIKSFNQAANIRNKLNVPRGQLVEDSCWTLPKAKWHPPVL